MATKPLRPCRHPGCCVLVPGGYCPEHQPALPERSAQSQSWRWMYQTAVWRELRAAQLLREPFCRACAGEGRRTPASDVDHIRDHKGDWSLFTDPENLQSLCHRCHSRKTMRDQRKFWLKTRRR